jgi:hypothetical protein
MRVCLFSRRDEWVRFLGEESENIVGLEKTGVAHCPLI